MNRAQKYWTLISNIRETEESIQFKIENSNLDNETKEEFLKKFNEYIESGNRKIEHLKDLFHDVEDFTRRKKNAENKLAGTKKKNRIAVILEILTLLTFIITSGIVSINITLLLCLISLALTGTYVFVNTKSSSEFDRVSVRVIKNQLESYNLSFDRTSEMVDEYLAGLQRWHFFITFNDKKQAFDNGLTKEEKKVKKYIKKI